MIENDDEAFADNYAERDQAKALREQARAGGLRFEAYLPGDMADWLLAQVERGHFVDPSEAVFAIVQNFIEMEPHRDLRDELLRRILDESVARGLEDVKAGRVRPADEVFDELRGAGAGEAPPRAGPLAEDRTMNQLAPLPSPALVLPALIAAADERARLRFLEFFAVTIRNPHTRRAYARAAGDFLAWCEARGVASLAGVQPLHVAAWVEALGRELAAPSVKQQLAGVRHLFDWLVTGHIVPVNPAGSVRGPAHSQRRGKTPVLAPDEARRLLDSIDVITHAGLRDRALIGLMVYSFARIGAALAMRVEDVFMQNRRLWVRLHEKGGKRHEMPCHHNLEDYLSAYIDGCELREDRKGPLFRTIARGTKRLSDTPLPQANAFAMVRRRAGAAEIGTAIGNHSFRATGITTYLKNGGTLETAATMANHSSTRTTQLYDRRPDDVTLDEVERVLI